MKYLRKQSAKSLKEKGEQPLTIKCFSAVIPWEAIKHEMYAKDYKEFVKWMGGQTVSDGGVFVDDLDLFLKNKKPKFID